MMIRSGFFNSVNGDRKYDARRFAEYFASFIGNGVFPDPSTGLQVRANNDMTVTVKPGKAWINGYILINDDDYILELDPADGVLSRIDRIVARYDVVDREIRLEVKKGAFASTPVAPALQRDADAYELGLADIYVAAGVVSIDQSNITDLRMNSNYCGIVVGTVQQIDTTDLFAQYQAAFEEVLDESVAGNLLNLINRNTADIAQIGSAIAQKLDAHWIVPGDDIILEYLDEKSKIGNDRKTILAVTVKNPGKYRITGTLASGDSSLTAHIQVFSVLQPFTIPITTTFTTTSTTGVDFVLDMTHPVGVGAIFFIQGWSSGVSTSVKLSNFRLRGVTGLITENAAVVYTPY